MNLRKSIALLGVVAMLGLLTALPAVGGSTATYEVTITNLTGGQPFTPALVATHKGSDGLFRVGETASFGLKEIAENGNLAPMVERVSSDSDIFDHVVQMGNSLPPVLPGETVSFSIQATQPYNFLSWASMLICSNDGFTGVDGLKLPNRVGQSVTVSTAGYDAGTEINTERLADIVPPCAPITGQDNMGEFSGMSDPALAEGGVIHHHGGILGTGNLDPAINDWTNPVATITVERTG